jgi:hypothetical protein
MKKAPNQAPFSKCVFPGIRNMLLNSIPELRIYIFAKSFSPIKQNTLL